MRQFQSHSNATISRTDLAFTKSTVLPSAKQIASSANELVRSGTFNPSSFDAEQLARCSTTAARSRLAREKALRWHVLPLSISRDCAGDEILSVVTTSEREAEVYQMLRFVFNGEIQIERVDSALNLARAIQSAYDGDLEVIEQAVRQAEAGSVSDGSISKLVQAVLDRARAINASDVHVVPLIENGTTANNFRLLYRVDGSLRSTAQLDLSVDLGWAFVRRLKVLAGLDLTNNHEPLEGACVIAHGKELTRIRLSIVPTVNGPKVALRLLKCASPAESISFCRLGLGDAQERTLKTALGLGGGVILCVGPTGSGKSTLLHAVMEYLRRPELHLVAIEDPVERFLPGISQCEINEARGVTYQGLLKAMLRQDPNVIMIGEIRDRETAEIAFAAGLSGHLILSTLHAGSCLEAFSRLSQLGVSMELSSLALRLVVSQRLMPLNCPACSELHPVAPLLANYLRMDAASKVKFGSGCARCDNSGYLGRTGVFEFLMCNENVKKAARLFAADNDAMRFRELLHEEHYEPYSWRVREALIDGGISPRAALEVLGLNPEIFGY